MTLASAPVSATASRIVLKIGTLFSNFCPPFPGVTPPTMRVPYSSICLAWNDPSRPVMPWTIRFVFRFANMLTRVDLHYCPRLALRQRARSSCGLPPCRQLHGALYGFVHVRHRGESVLGENLQRHLFVGAGEPNHDRDLE